jgi:hypothetical protein
MGDAIAKTKRLASSLEAEEVLHLDMVNMGGGFPAPYMRPANKLSEYAAEIHRYLTNAFGKDFPSIILELGRSVTGNSGILVSEVILVFRKNSAALNHRVYLDAGKFNRLIETLNGTIKYPIVTSKDSPFCTEIETILAGTLCDSADILYEDYKYKLPIDLAIGDRVYFLSAGAYTASYASVGFNGFAPIDPPCEEEQMTDKRITVVSPDSSLVKAHPDAAGALKKRETDLCRRGPALAGCHRRIGNPDEGRTLFLSMARDYEDWKARRIALDCGCSAPPPLPFIPFSAIVSPL